MNKMAYLEENIAVSERYELALNRIRGIAGEDVLEEPYRSYFKKEAEFLLTLANLYEQVQYGDYEQFTVEELREKNRILYAEPKENYEESYLNPAYSVSVFGKETGQALCYVAFCIRKGITAAIVQRLKELVLYMELLIRLYNLFESGEGKKELKNTIYWFEHDYAQYYADISLDEMLDEKYSVYRDLVMDADLNDEKYLYYYGLHISDNERKTAGLFASFSEEKVNSMAKTFTEGYRKGFELAGKDLGKKKTVEIRYAVGFERMVRAAVRQFEAMGLHTVICCKGVSSTPENRQCTYDHKDDQGLILDKHLVNHKLEAVRNAFESRKEPADFMAGPAVLETFGENPFTPAEKEEAITLDEKQRPQRVRYQTEYVQIYYKYIKGEERSFTIIAYPIPEIGENYEEIFEDTIRINNLDSAKYSGIQKNIIDVLDCGESVIVKGRGDNCTDMKVQLHPLTDPDHQTNFENCVADVNIPLGEVFTSPVLAGTEGVLNVSEVYLNGLKYVNLKLDFKDGKITGYTCDNFDTEEKNQKFIRENLLKFRESLPIGEFAIGTNTTAYVIAGKHKIVYKMPILIVEKMGPHFAVGDTCYSHEEDEKTYNPDGKEIIAKENEISALRKEKTGEAYFGCHTDITIPYDEIGEISAVTGTGEKITIIRDGRFVLAGTEELNLPFEEK